LLHYYITKMSVIMLAVNVFYEYIPPAESKSKFGN